MPTDFQFEASSILRKVDHICGVRLPSRPSSSLWDISLAPSPSDNFRGTVSSITPHGSPATSNTHGSSSLLLPSLCHPHIHLDKAFLLSSSQYDDFVPTKGDFQEALTLTCKAKARFNPNDLLRRGDLLIAESIAAGVTAIRAFVEVDHTVQLTCLDTAIQLKRKWSRHCHVQLVAFAQDPIFSGPYGSENREYMHIALGKREVDVLGTTPYVETDSDAAKDNIEWAIEWALRHNLHLDFHLDYSLDGAKQPMTWDVLRMLRSNHWPASSQNSLRVMLGHCTRLTLFSPAEWQRLAEEVNGDESAGQSPLPVSFVGLPTSDLYMMGRPPQEDENGVHQRPRGTLQIPHLIKTYNLSAAIGINNVGNAFTPWGNCDPLSIASLGVGLYHAGAQKDAELLFECVSTRAREAIGLPTAESIDVKEGDPADFVLVSGGESLNFEGIDGIEPRPRRTVAEVVWDPPPTAERRTVFGGCLVK